MNMCRVVALIRPGGDPLHLSSRERCGIPNDFGLRRSIVRLISLIVVAFALVAGSAVTPWGHPAASGAVTGNDYPSTLANARKDSLVDPWSFYNRECTSFVAWKLNHNNGVAFRDFYGGLQWGNASNWGRAARLTRDRRE